MKEMNCNHCGKAFDEEMLFCPNCNTPTPKQKDLETAGTQNLFIRFFVILVVFCIIMMLWLPRDI